MEINNRDKDITWGLVACELLRLLDKKTLEMSSEERTVVRAIPYKLRKKLRDGVQAWEDIPSDAWVFIDKHIKNAHKWKPMLHL